MGIALDDEANLSGSRLKISWHKHNDSFPYQQNTVVIPPSVSTIKLLYSDLFFFAELLVSSITSNKMQPQTGIFSLQCQNGAEESIQENY